MDFTQLVATCGSWAVLEFVAIQCAGIAFPGGAVLLAAAVYAGTNHQVALAPIILAAAVGSILGNLLGYVLGDSFHRPTGPLGIALAVLVLCLFVTCIAILLRNLKRLEDQAVRMLPDPLALDVGKKKQHAPQDS